MPMYEYGCLDCQGHFDRLRRMDQDDSGVTCPHCRSARIQRQLSAFASISRGSEPGLPAQVAGPKAGGCCGGGGCGCGSRN